MVIETILIQVRIQVVIIMPRLILVGIMAGRIKMIIYIG
jgi:hypothetical protein